MLKLIYHTAVFGPIDLEYDRAVVRVGRSEDNDLVLRHPSVEDHHCLLTFQGEKVLLLPPAASARGDGALAAAREFGVGDRLRIGELEFTLAHSSSTVALPSIRPATPEPQSPALPDPGPDEHRYFCSNCTRFFLESEIKLVGLVGHPKRSFCPQCSHLLQPELKAENQSPAKSKG